MTVLSMHLMSRHRQAEWTDAHWLEEYETRRFGTSWHGRTWAAKRIQERSPDWPSRFLSRFRGFEVWIGGLAIFGLAALTVLILAVFWPTLLGK